MKKQENTIIFLMCFIGVIIASLPLFGNTVFGVDVQDTFFHTQRIWSVKNALEAGQFPVRLYSEIYNGYGYGASLFYPDIFLYIPAVLCMLGLPLATSYNVFLMLINVATMGASYYSYRRITRSNMTGALAALLYVLSTYRLLDLYTRASIGECLALIFCPLALCGLTCIADKEYDKWWLLALSYTGLLQAHIISFVMMAVVAVLYAAFHIRAYTCGKAIGAVGKAVLLVMGVNAWFLVPFLQVSGMNVIAFLGTASFWETSASLGQLFDVLCLSAGGSEVYTGAITDSMPKTPGVLLLAGAVLLVFALILHDEDIREERKRVYGYLASGLLATWMITNLFPWGLVQRVGIFRAFFEKFQFAWRFNILAVLCLSVAAAYGFYYFFMMEAVHKQKAFVLLGVVVIFSSTIYINQYIKQSTEYTNEAVMEKGYMDRLYVVPGFNTQGDGSVVSNLSGAQFTNVFRGYNEITLDFAGEAGEATEEAPYIEVPITYYPGYKAYLDGKEAETECSIWGVVRVILPQDCTEGTLYVTYEEGTAVAIANVISLITIIGVLAGIFWKGVFKR